MKIANKYFKPLSLLIMLALMVVSCTEFKEFESTTYGPGPTITIAEVSVQDSTFTVSVTSSADGFASLILLPGSGNVAPEDPEDLLTGNVAAMEYQSKPVIANEATNFTFSGLVQYAIYEVQGAANNADGKPSEVSTLGIGTDDTHAPTISGTDPGTGYDAVLPVDGTVVLVFDEPVLYDDTKDLTFNTLFGGGTILAGTVDVDYNVVTITPEDSLANREYLWLSYPEGTFRDYSDNLVAEMDSYFDGSNIYGLYWRIEAKVFEALSVTPEEELLEPGFDIVVTFADGVSISNSNGPLFEDGDITLTYDDGMDVLIKSVLVADVSAVGTELTIVQSYTPSPGTIVTLNIPASTIQLGIGNPNGEVTATWQTKVTLASLVGNYNVAAVSFSTPGDWDEVWAATVELIAGNDTALSITIDAGDGGGVAFLAGFDVETNDIVILSGTNAGDIYGYGTTSMYGSDATTYLGGPVSGTISNAILFGIDEMGMYLPDYDNGDGTFGTLWDAFSTTWTKSATKSAIARSINPVKAARFK